MKRALIGLVAVIGGLMLGAACEERPGNAQRGGTTSSPPSRGPGGPASPSGSSAPERGSGGMGSGSATSPSSSSGDLSGTGGAGDAGTGGRDSGYR